MMMCDFMMGLGQPKLCTKFEVASFSWLDLRGPSSKGRKEKGRKREGERGRRDGRGKGRNDLPYDLSDLEMTWLL